MCLPPLPVRALASVVGRDYSPFAAAWTIARMPALTAFGRLGQARSTGVTSGMCSASNAKQDAKTESASP